MLNGKTVLITGGTGSFGNKSPFLGGPLWQCDGFAGSVIPLFIKLRDEGVTELPITDMRMTRFNISLQEGVDLVMWTLGHHLGGELFIPKIPSYKITDVAKAIAPDLPMKEIGIRPGEKLHEEMITPTDSLSTIDLGRYYASDNNDQWDTVESLRDKFSRLIPNFHRPK